MLSTKILGLQLFIAHAKQFQFPVQGSIHYSVTGDVQQVKWIEPYSHCLLWKNLS